MRAVVASLLVVAACSGPTPAPEAPAPRADPPQPTVAADVMPAKASFPVEPDTAPRAEAEVPAEAAPEPVAPPTLPEGTVVAHIGDSMAQALGMDLKRELAAVGIRAPLHAKEATYIPQWAGTKWGVDLFLSQTKPDFVIITLGGNEAAMPDPTIRADPIRRLVKKVGDVPCIWIAAPLWPGAKNTGILEVIEQNCAPCRFVDTNALIHPKMEVQNDGVHPTLPERERWAKYMMRWLRHNRDPNGGRPWDLKARLEPVPEGASW